MMPVLREEVGGDGRSAGAERSLVVPLTACSQNGSMASKRILVVCGAGASSTFVAQRLQRAATDAQLPWEASAGTELTIASHVPDMVLVGPHLGDRLDAIRAAAACPVLPLPDDIFSDRDGTRTLVLVRSVLTAEKGTP